MATSDERKHPDLFTPEEAVTYLHLENVRQLETLRASYGLVGYPGVGKGFMYWREDLDNTAKRICGRDKLSTAKGQKLRMAQ